MKKIKIKARFAPSPTGELHIGSVRTALFNYLFARHNKGKIILRIEDTDAKRFIPGSVERLVESMKWLGIEFDEGVRITQKLNLKTKNQKLKLKTEDLKINQFGKYGPYIQSQRLGIYQEYAQKLIEDGNAYYCFCSEERLKKMRENQIKKKQAPMYDRKCIELTPSDIQNNIKIKKPYVIRLKVPYGGKTSFDDLIRGHIEIDNETIDDQILIKSDGMPTYHLANVVDDHLMGITHVLRAEEWLSSTPKHILLYNYLGWKPPQFAHIPLVLATDKSKLSKRHGAISVEEFIKLGYLPEAIINYIALLGWNPKTEKEFFTLPELIKEFEISKVNKASAVFDIEKLNYFNQRYIKNLSNDKLIKLLSNSRFPNISKININQMNKIITIIKDRMITLLDFSSLSKIFLDKPKYKSELLIFKKSNKESTIQGLKLTADSLQIGKSKEWESVDKLNTKLLKIIHDNNISNGDVFWPVRVALSGMEKSPSPVELLWVFGKNESMKRINNAINKLSNLEA